MPITKITANKCAWCGWTWVPRPNKTGKMCPKCKRIDWNSKPKGR